MIKINMENFNFFTIISILMLLAGIIYYVYWGIRFSVWFDIGIYSLTIVFVLAGFLGVIITLYENPEKENN